MAGVASAGNRRGCVGPPPAASLTALDPRGVRTDRGRRVTPASGYAGQRCRHLYLCRDGSSSVAFSVPSGADFSVFQRGGVETYASITCRGRTSRLGERRRPIGGVTVESIRHKRVKMLAAAAIAGAFVAIGAAAAVAVSQQQTGTLIGGPMTVGQTATTTTTPPAEPAVTKAAPPVTATKPKSF